MKHLFVLTFIIICTCQLVAQKTQDNEQYNVAINANNKYEALLQLSQQINVNFVYNASIVTQNTKIKFNLKQAVLTDILQQILKQEFYGYHSVGNQIVLLPPENNDTSAINYRVSGILLNNATNKAIEFASVSLKNNQTGTISNIDGEFSLQIDSIHLSDTLVFSAMGFSYKLIPVNELVGKGSIIRLEQFVIPIQEVYVRERNPELLVRKCIAISTETYLAENTQSEAFYREYILKNNTLQSLYESTLYIWQPKQRGRTYQVKIKKALRGYDIREKDTITVKLQGGLYSISMIDVIREQPLFFNEENINAYHYIFKDIISNGKRNLYVVDFKPKNNYLTVPYSGSLYIDAENLTLSKVDVQLKNENSRFSFGIITKKKSKYLRPKIQQTNYTLHYQNSLKGYNLQHARLEIFLKVRKRKSIFNSDYKLVSEILMEKWETGNIEKFNKKEVEHSNKVFTEIIKKYQTEYWGPDNYLVPEEVIDKALFQNY